jgi:hypothetical protein
VNTQDVLLGAVKFAEQSIIAECFELYTEEATTGCRGGRRLGEPLRPVGGCDPGVDHLS